MGRGKKLRKARGVPGEEEPAAINNCLLALAQPTLPATRGLDAQAAWPSTGMASWHGLGCCLLCLSSGIHSFTVLLSGFSAKVVPPSPHTAVSRADGNQVRETQSLFWRSLRLVLTGREGLQGALVSRSAWRTSAWTDRSSLAFTEHGSPWSQGPQRMVGGIPTLVGKQIS